MRYSTWMLVVLISLVSAQLVLAQNPPPGPADPFFDDEEFDGPPVPPGTFAPPPGIPGQKTFGDGAPTSNVPGSQPSGAQAGGAAEPSFKGAQPSPRRKRNEPPNPLAAKPKVEDPLDKEITDENYPDLIDSFDYPNAEITDIVKAVSELTGKNFILDQAVRGKITIIAPTRITVAEAYRAFLSALAINGFTVVPSGKFLKIKPAANAQRDNLDTYSGAYSPNTDQMITRIIQLRYISAKEVFNSLGPLLQSRLGELRPYEPTNTLIVSDYGSNIERIMKILKQLDVPGFEEQLEVIRIRYAKASELAKLVDQIINKGKNQGQGPAGGFTAGIPRFTPLGGTQSSSNEAFSLVIPDDRTNSLIVVGNNQGIAKIRKLVSRLDFRIRPEDAGGVYVYYVRYGDSEKIATTLSGLAQASTQAAGSGAGAAPASQKTMVFGGDVKIVADKTTNSLVVTASKQDYEVVQAILAKLDIPRDQVYVEGVFLELNVDNIKEYGISYYNLPGKTFAGRAGFSSQPLSKFTTPGNSEGAILGFGNSSMVTVTPPGGSAIEIPSLVGFINFLQTVATVNILSTPQIMALDNEEAEIEVGDKVPTGTAVSTANNGTTTNSVTRDDLTIKLNIKPHISPGSKTIRLEIQQAIKGVSSRTIGPANLRENALATTQRTAKTNVLVRDGDTVVLGGLMNDEERVESAKVPLLGDIPIIGWLFKSKKTTLSKQNLMLFLTPKIIRNSYDAAQMTEQKFKERIDFIHKNAGGVDGKGELLEKVKLKKGTQP
ncbi:MAG: type II secretion system secretin GspD [Oligoflexia bacterium]|nr:type II secretion system secretin GspD [Oligoflexia bacterium]